MDYEKPIGLELSVLALETFFRKALSLGRYYESQSLGCITTLVLISSVAITGVVMVKTYMVVLMNQIMVMLHCRQKARNSFSTSALNQFSHRNLFSVGIATINLLATEQSLNLDMPKH